MVKSPRTNEFHTPLQFFQQELCWEMHVIQTWILCSQLITRINLNITQQFTVNEKSITTISTLYGSTLADNKITSQGYLSSALITAEAVKNDLF